MRVNVLTSIKSSYVQNMIENMILTSYSDKSYLGASWGGCCKHANDVVWLVLKHKWTILVAWQSYLVMRHNFHVALGVTLHHDWKTSRCYDRCIFRLTTCQVLQHGAPFLLYSISTVKSCIQQTAFLDLAYCFLDNSALFIYWSILVTWQNYLVTRYNFHVASGVTNGKQVDAMIDAFLDWLSEKYHNIVHHFCCIRPVQ